MTAMVILLTLSHCGKSDPDREANRLFVEAYRLSENAAELEQQDPVAAFEKYNQALQNIDKIIEEYPDTPVAVDATQQRTLLGDMSIGKLRLTVPRMKDRASALDNFHELTKYLSDRRGELQKVEYLINYAGYLYRFEHTDHFAEIITEVSEMAHNHWNTEVSDSIYMRLSGLYAATESWNKAIEMADYIQNQQLIRSSLEKIIDEGFVADQKGDAPDRLSDLISFLNPNRRLHIISNLSSALLEADCREVATDLVRSNIQGPDTDGALERIDVLNELATTFSRYGEFELVDEIVSKIDNIDDDYTGFALREKATQMYRQGKRDEAMEMIASFDRNYFRHTSLSEIAVQRAESGLITNALELVDELPDQMMEKTDSKIKIAYILADFGDYERSDSLINAVLPGINELGSSLNRARKHLMLAEIYAMRNERSLSAGALERAEDHAKEISGSESINSVLTDIFRLWVDLGRPDRALDLAAWFRMDHDSFEKSIPGLFRHAIERDYHDLAKSLAGITDSRAYFEYILNSIYLDMERTVRSRQLAYDIRSFEWRARAVSDLAMELKMDNEDAASNKAATDVLQMLDRIRNKENRERSLLYVSKRLSAAGIAMNEERKTLLKELVGQLDY